MEEWSHIFDIVLQAELLEVDLGQGDVPGQPRGGIISMCAVLFSDGQQLQKPVIEVYDTARLISFLDDLNGSPGEEKNANISDYMGQCGILTLPCSQRALNSTS